MNQRQSCGSCHVQRLGFTDRFHRAVGAFGDLHSRNTLPLANVGYARVLTWADPGLSGLEEQIDRPLFGTHPVELGMGGREQELLDRLRSDPFYAENMPRVFPIGEPFLVENVRKALAAFERTLVSFDSAYDRFVRGDAGALDEQARRGMTLFFSDRARCASCHGGDRFDTPSPEAESKGAADGFANTGLYDVDGHGGYPENDAGLFAITGRSEDTGRFRIPTLRNVAVTGPYAHDGTLETLEDVVAHYVAGGRLVASGPHAGDGRRNRYKSALVSGFEATDEERNALVSFLRSLTDETFLNNPAFSDPNPAPSDE